VLGSDYPFPLGEAHPGKLVESMQQLSSNVKVHCCVLLGNLFNYRFEVTVNEFDWLPRLFIRATLCQRGY